MLTTIPFDSRIPGKRRAAFLILHAKKALYANYPGVSDSDRKLEIPVCLMLRRWDGKTGFPGGLEEDGESLEDAIIREVWEEARFEITKELRQSLKPVVAHDIGKLTTHAMSLRLGWTQLKRVAQGVFGAEHFGTECCGPALEHLVDYEQFGKKPAGLQYLLRVPLATSVREELVHFISAEGYATPSSLRSTCEKAGYDFDKLFQLPQGSESADGDAVTMHACVFDGDRPHRSEGV